MKQLLNTFIAALFALSLNSCATQENTGYEVEDLLIETTEDYSKPTLVCIFRNEANILHTSYYKSRHEFVTNTYFFTDSLEADVTEAFDMYASLMPASYLPTDTITPHSFPDAKSAYQAKVKEISGRCRNIFFYTEAAVTRRKEDADLSYFFPHFFVKKPPGF